MGWSLHPDNQIAAFLDEMLQSRDKFKVGATSLEVIRNPQKYLDDHEAFELFELEDQIKRGGKDKFRFDLKYQHKQNKGKIFFVDTKNYESLSGIFSGKNLDQLKAYFRESRNFRNFGLCSRKGEFIWHWRVLPKFWGVPWRRIPMASIQVTQIYLIALELTEEQ